MSKSPSFHLQIHVGLQLAQDGRAQFRGFSLSTGNQGVDQLNLKNFRKCGITPLLFPLILALSSMTGCIEGVPQSLHASSMNGADLQSGEWSGQLRMEIDPELDSDLFSLRGNVILTGNGTLPYLLLNATLRQGAAYVVSTKYLMMNLEPNRDYSFEIARNSRLLPGEYICTLEASGPSGSLASESRMCSLAEDPQNSPSSVISPEGYISLSDAQALFTGRGLYERTGQMESTSRVEREHEKESEIEAEEESNIKAEEESNTEAEEESNTEAEEESNIEADKESGIKGDEESGIEAQKEHEKEMYAGEPESKVRAEGEEEQREDENDYLDRSVENGDETKAGTAGDHALESIAAYADHERPDEGPGELLVASSTSKKYHLPDCRYALKIKPENRISFQSAEEAKSQGYLPCKSCHP